MTEFNLRPATEADTDAITTVWHAGWPDGHLGNVPDELLEHRRLADFRRMVTARIDATTVAVSDDTVIGFVTVHGDEVEEMYVGKAARGSGVAAMLLTHAEQTIANRHDRAWLAVVAGNVRARRFYERQGWQDAGPFDYFAEVGGGTFTVPCHRYEKQLTRGPQS
jgi:GNAT superfamily N-acetyltransferase